MGTQKNLKSLKVALKFTFTQETRKVRTLHRALPHSIFKRFSPTGRFTVLSWYRTQIIRSSGMAFIQQQTCTKSPLNLSPQLFFQDAPITSFCRSDSGSKASAKSCCFGLSGFRNVAFRMAADDGEFPFSSPHQPMQNCGLRRYAFGKATGCQPPIAVEAFWIGFDYKREEAFAQSG